MKIMLLVYLCIADDPAVLSPVIFLAFPPLPPILKSNPELGRLFPDYRLTGLQIMNRALYIFCDAV